MRERYYARIAEQAEAGDGAEKLAERQRKAFARSVKSLVDAKLLVAAKHKGERFLWPS